MIYYPTEKAWMARVAAARAHRMMPEDEKDQARPRLCAGCGKHAADDESLCGVCSSQLLTGKCVWEGKS